MPHLPATGSKQIIPSTSCRLRQQRQSGVWHLTELRDMLSAERKFKHAPGALADMLSNLVKNWEKEASYKLDSRDWRTIDHRCYQCALLFERWLCFRSLQQMAWHQVPIKNIPTAFASGASDNGGLEFTRHQPDQPWREWTLCMQAHA